MSIETENVAGWSRKRWATVVLAVFVAHLVALMLLSARRDATPSHAIERSFVRWLTSSVEARKILDSVVDNDPTLLATVNLRGFSGAAWLRPSAQTIRIGEWTDAERSLPQLARPLGGVPQLDTASANSAVLDPARKPTSAAPALTVAQPELRSASRLLVIGPLATRRLIQTVPLKSWSHTDLLADTRVQVLVSREGLVFSRRLASTGQKNQMQKDADQHALALTTELRFESGPKLLRAGEDGIVEGTLVFQWHTVEPTAAAEKE